ncbi:MAG: hypothetical protein JKY37_19410, partial [Nannocystaceae bacterium]|nr:hypothetical protein [Nannocystaceae bacterium]
SVHYVALCVGQSLADAGRPGAWERIDIDVLMACVADEGQARAEFVATLWGLLSWMDGVGLLNPRCARQYLVALQSHRSADCPFPIEVTAPYGMPLAGTALG